MFSRYGLFPTFYWAVGWRPFLWEFIVTKNQWSFFCHFRNDFRQQCDQWNARFAEILNPLQRTAAVKDTPEYSVETGVVYNRSLDDVTEEAEIRLIVIGDNPGKDEQLHRNQRYLVGQAGKIAEGFFSRHPELGIDFRKNTIILNKTPVHTAKTAHLKYLLKNGNDEVGKLIKDSQLWMAEQTARLHQILCEGGNSQERGFGCQLWLVGYAELKGRGLFLQYRDKLADCYKKNDGTKNACCEEVPQFLPEWNQVMVYQHFSMNRFTIDLDECLKNGKISSQLSLKEKLAALGKIHRQEIFGF